LAVCADDGRWIETLESALPVAERVAASAHSGRRRRQFSLGRLAAHTALARLGELTDAAPASDLALESDACGAPRLPESCGWHVGIAHSGTLAVACAWARTAAPPRLGIDLERVRETDIARSPYAFSRRERRVLSGVRMRASMAGVLGWVAKEATWKALRLPPNAGPDVVELRALTVDHAIVVPRHGHSALDGCQATSFAVQLQTLSGPDGDYVMGLSAGGDANDD
jgi:4'-phosphopantetheinyl transferase EntD